MRNITDRELKNASLSQLESICDELRNEIVDTVSHCGGHLSSNLGAVELTVALHRVFCFPKDKIIFDVGHQCYAHKLLSDRAESFHTLRKRGGISGFPKRSESEYDCYGTGHAGTAISAALGFAKARDLHRENFEVIALVGDGSFNNGLIYEAFNSLRVLKTPILIILNDNDMSISETVGGMHDMLDALKSGGTREGVDLFEGFGLQYCGVYDGHDLSQLIPALESAKSQLKNGCVLFHVHTRKGCGLPFCENSPTQTHGVSVTSDNRMEYAAALGEELTAIASRNENVVAITAAMTDSLGLRGFFNHFADRAFDVGICEEHASILTAAMAAAGMKPYFAIYSTFLQRAFDEIIHDVCVQNLPVTFCIDRGGVSGNDGETHQGVFDLSYLSMIPNLTIAIPKDIGEFRAMLRMSECFQTPLAIRYPHLGCDRAVSSVEIGKFEVLHSNMSNIILLAAGERCIGSAERIRRKLNREGIDFQLVNARFLKPLDTQFLQSVTQSVVITMEDNVLIGGLGDAVARFYRGSEKKIFSFGYRDEFIPHGNPDELMREFGLGEEEIIACIRSHYARG